MAQREFIPGLRRGRMSSFSFGRPWPVCAGIALLGCCMLQLTAARAQSAGGPLHASQTMEIRAQIVEGLAVVVNRPLTFGPVVAGAGPVTVSKGAPAAGAFVVTGQAGETLTIRYYAPQGNRLRRVGGEGALGLSTRLYGSEVDRPAAADVIQQGSVVTFDEDGRYHFYVQGTLDVGAAEDNPAGSYEGLFTLVIAYP